MYNRGFNLILHGRNEQKVRAVVEGLRARGGGAGREVRYFIADASKPGHDFAALIAPFKDLHITLVYHNVGGSPWVMERYVHIHISTCGFQTLVLLVPSPPDILTPA